MAFLQFRSFSFAQISLLLTRENINDPPYLEMIINVPYIGNGEGGWSMYLCYSIRSIFLT